jgi:hypothetical protein
MSWRATIRNLITHFSLCASDGIVFYDQDPSDKRFFTHYNIQEQTPFSFLMTAPRFVSRHE